MTMPRMDETPTGTARRYTARMAQARLAAACLTIAISLGLTRPLCAARPAPDSSESSQGTSSNAAQRDAIRMIPLDKLDRPARAKVATVLDNVTAFRRMPVRVVCSDAELYLFAVRHPDVIVNIWEVLGVSQLQLRQTGPDAFRVDEKEGISASLQFLYHDSELHVIYGDWSYRGALLSQPVQGHSLAVLRSKYLRDTDGRSYVVSHLDAFVNVEPGGVELLTKIFHPVVAKTADANFTQTVAFVGSLSRTAEVNNRGLQRLAAKLAHVQPEVRQQFADVAASVAQKQPSGPIRQTSSETADSTRVAERHDGEQTR
jgi:hypothetical protein